MIDLLAQLGEIRVHLPAGPALPLDLDGAGNAADPDPFGACPTHRRGRRPVPVARLRRLRARQAPA